jgi:hypothetical protein
MRGWGGRTRDKRAAHRRWPESPRRRRGRNARRRGAHPWHEVRWIWFWCGTF